MSRRANRDPRTRQADDLTTLAVTAMAALYEAELFEQMELVRARVLARGAALFQEIRRADGCRELRYAPMAELVLLHVRETAVAPWPAERRATEIAWALDAAGF